MIENQCYLFLVYTIDGGFFILAGVEKAKPWACPKPWYGSCPNITTFRLSSFVKEKALKQMI